MEFRLQAECRAFEPVVRGVRVVVLPGTVALGDLLGVDELFEPRPRVGLVLLLPFELLLLIGVCEIRHAHDGDPSLTGMRAMTGMIRSVLRW